MMRSLLSQCHDIMDQDGSTSRQRGAQRLRLVQSRNLVTCVTGEDFILPDPGG